MAGPNVNVHNPKLCFFLQHVMCCLMIGKSLDISRELISDKPKKITEISIASALFY